MRVDFFWIFMLPFEKKGDIIRYVDSYITWRIDLISISVDKT